MTTNKMEAYDFTLKTGKYSGELMSYVVHMDPGYYQWMLNNTTYFNRKQRRKIKKWIAKRDAYFDEASSLYSSS